MPSLNLDFATAWSNWLMRLSVLLTDAASPFWWPTLVTTLIAAVVLIVARHVRGDPPPVHQPRTKGLLKELWVDVGCFLANGYVAALLAPLLISATISGTTMVILLLGMPATTATGTPDWALCLTAAAVAFVAGDFFLYWTHRAFHRYGILWAMHRLHHSPHVLTPITAFRFWPPEHVVHMLGFNFGVGIAMGIMYMIHGSAVPATSVAGANVFMIVWSLAFAHLRHSHVPMAFPAWLSCFLVSPHMHQAHHSVAPQHHNCNYGTALALWDWIFGTLYVPEKQERYRFGINAS